MNKPIKGSLIESIDNIILKLKDSSPTDKLLGIQVDMHYEN